MRGFVLGEGGLVVGVDVSRASSWACILRLRIREGDKRKAGKVDREFPRPALGAAEGSKTDMEKQIWLSHGPVQTHYSGKHRITIGISTQHKRNWQVKAYTLTCR